MRFPQLQEPFDGPEITSDNPWRGDLDCFMIDNGLAGLMCGSCPGKRVLRDSDYLFGYYAMGVMCWNGFLYPAIEIMFDSMYFKITRAFLGLKLIIIYRSGSNKKTITLRRQVETEKKS